jgi:hypothetical protein
MEVAYYGGVAITSMAGGGRHTGRVGGGSVRLNLNTMVYLYL